ncbi:Predicted PurR-regulated permease PerM [Flavobacteriaceae bacterium MAR_2010_188]|nr:Predicted PurR-regulated permease PerM [Flavobacteriaceae bacterium MAR_2010_188]
MDKRRTTNILLLIIVIPLIFYLLKTLKFIFIPLVFSMFIALLFLPIMRAIEKKGVPKIFSVLAVICIIIAILFGGFQLIQLTSKELLTADSHVFPQINEKIGQLFESLSTTFNFTFDNESPILPQLLSGNDFGPIIGFFNRTLTMTLMTVFFVVLWLGESINVQRVLNALLIKKRHTSIKAFIRIEDDILTFIKVKFIVSALTGIFTGLMCVFFDVSFPIFWGLFAFSINFIQMVGSFITVIVLSLFALVQLDLTSTLLFFVLSITGVQVLFGSILEPIFMGRSFSINVITVLVMLLFWGYIWGVPGMIMSIPITVFIKIILEQFPNTKIIAELISGHGIQLRKREYS